MQHEFNFYRYDYTCHKSQLRQFSNIYSAAIVAYGISYFVLKLLFVYLLETYKPSILLFFRFNVISVSTRYCINMFTEFQM